ncbi:hypothetical protein BD410DRAFT_836421 [Rickenella mellea]|uniref:BTB domain-containing protein n=1 Tax=Rickenella mellea TaxID=50990 RepID=A0A4Y7QFY3_9AGAM|nr:hypothetical protein BD410DRAFT_836421 [Rickenella mellea]
MSLIMMSEPLGPLPTGPSVLSVASELNPPSYHPSSRSQDAEVIVRSNDGVLFRVEKLVLHRGSGFFKRMFEMPSDSVEASENDPIRIQESSKVFAMLLSIIHPAHEYPDSLDSLEFTSEVLQAAEKYDMRKVPPTIRIFVRAQRKFLTEQPFERACEPVWLGGNSKNGIN